MPKRKSNLGNHFFIKMMKTYLSRVNRSVNDHLCSTYWLPVCEKSTELYRCYNICGFSIITFNANMVTVSYTIKKLKKLIS